MSDRVIIHPENEAHWKAERALDVTSTESPALFDMSPYLTQLELWHRKKNATIVDFDANGRMKWGTLLQDVIGRTVAEEQGWSVRRMSQYIRIADAHMGASFDFEIVSNERGPGILEVKNVDGLVFRDQWIVNEDKSIEAPPQIEIQLQHQLHCANRAWGAIAVLVGGNNLHILIRGRDIEVGQEIERRCRDLFATIQAGTPPAPTFPDDAAFLCKLYGYAEPGKVFDGRGDHELAELARQYAEAGAIEKQAKEDKEVAKAKLLVRIGDAEKAVLDGFNLSAGVVGPASIAYEREGYRSFRLTAQKKKMEKISA